MIVVGSSNNFIHFLVFLEEEEGFKPNDRGDNASLNFTTQLRTGALCCGLQLNYNFLYEII